MEPEIILILLTVTGAIVVALFGWIESEEDFDFRKFAPSIARAIIGGLLASRIFEGTKDPTIWVYLTAFLIGAGIDVAGNRLAGAYRARKNSL